MTNIISSFAMFTFIRHNGVLECVPNKDLEKILLDYDVKDFDEKVKSLLKEKYLRKLEAIARWAYYGGSVDEVLDDLMTSYNIEQEQSGSEISGLQWWKTTKVLKGKGPKNLNPHRWDSLYQYNWIHKDRRHKVILLNGEILVLEYGCKFLNFKVEELS